MNKTNLKLAFSIPKEDFDWTYTRVGGHGGQKVNKTSTGVRCVHRASGAVGESRRGRSQLANRKNALERLIETKEFKLWLKQKTAFGPTPEERVAQDMQPQNIKIEIQRNGKWSTETQN
jgi:protein subunit release factor B